MKKLARKPLVGLTLSSNLPSLLQGEKRHKYSLDRENKNIEGNLPDWGQIDYFCQQTYPSF